MDILTKINQLLKFIKTPKAFEVLDGNVHGFEGTFTQGGCLILADMLDILFNGQIVALRSLSKGGIEHFGYRIPSVGIVDGDSLYLTNYKWIDSFAELESLNASDLIASSFVEDESTNGIVRDKKCSKKLARVFTETVRNSNLYKPNCVRTISGNYVDLVNPDIDSINIEDIAHALSRIPRFGGHLQEHYSVAQHSVECMRLANSDIALETLLHDAPEAYLLDIPSPLKKMLPDYQKVEGIFSQLIADKFGLKYPFDKKVKEIDVDILQIEWDCLALNLSDEITAWSADQAKEKFLEAFHDIKKRKNKTQLV